MSVLPLALMAASPLRTLEPDAPANGKTSAPKAAGANFNAKRSSAGKGRTVTVDGQDYRSLDEYLAKLERDGHVGKAWYKQVQPGVYELVTNMRPAPEKRLFTRAELEREFGFAQ